jgi:hypothetical protein
MSLILFDGHAKVVKNGVFTNACKLLAFFQFLKISAKKITFAKKKKEKKRKTYRDGVLNRALAQKSNFGIFEL